MEIYADIIFLINFFMVFFIFFVSDKFIKNNVSKKRLFWGSFTASLLYCCVIFVDSLNLLYNPLGIIFIFIVSVFITFGANNFKSLLKKSLIVMLISISIGGLATFIFYFFNLSNFIGNFVKVYIQNFSLSFLVISIVIFYIFLKLVIFWYQKVIIQKQKFYNIEIFLNGNRVKLNALVDTGNSLCDPISGKPIIISEFEKIKKILPSEFNDFFSKTGETDLEKIYDFMKENSTGLEIRILPFSSLGKTKGLIVGFLSDKTVVYTNDKMRFDKAIIGICTSKLSQNDTFDALLNPKMIDIKN